MSVTTYEVRWAGFTWADRAPWRVVSCNACGKSHYLMAPTDESTEALIRAHRCGPIGTPWATPQSSTSAPYAFLLASMVGEVHKQPYGSHEFPDVAGAALDLIAALASQLPAGLIRIEWPDDELPAELADATLDDLQEKYDDAAEHAAAVSVATLLALDARARAGLPGGFAAYSLDEMLAVLAGEGRTVIGVAWPSWDQCIGHLVADIRSGRLASVHDPATVGLLIVAGDGPPMCSGCALPPTGETPAVPA